MTVEHETTTRDADDTAGGVERAGAMAVPPQVSFALRASLLQMVVMAVATAVTWAMRDDLRDAWITARAAATDQTIAAVEESSAKPFAFFPVTLTMTVTYVLLALVLVAMVRVGARWARYSLTLLIAMTALVQAVVGTGPGVPATLMAFAAVSVALHGLTLLMLWHPATNGFYRSAHNGYWARVVDRI